MKLSFFAKNILASAALTLAASAAHAEIYHFTQTGFNDGASVSGFFQGFDMDHDGHITSNELVDFSAHVSGGRLDQLPFNYFWRWIPAINYTIGSNTLAAEPNGYFSAWSYAGFDYLSTSAGATISDAYGSYGSISTNQVINVNPVASVPEPETYAMMLGGLGLLAFVARRKKQA